MNIRVIWTQHAIQRAGERFGFLENIKIPNGMIQLIASRSDDGKKFRLGLGDVVYICVKSGDSVYIVTVQRKKNDTSRGISSAQGPSRVAKGSKRRSYRSKEAIGSHRSDFEIRGSGD